jgi:hypothetical protein
MSSSRISRLIAGALILLAGLSEQVAGQGLQPQADYEAALGHYPGSPYVVYPIPPYAVRIMVVDDRTGQASTVCVGANLLKGAIYLEKWGSFYQPDTPRTNEGVPNFLNFKNQIRPKPNPEAVARWKEVDEIAVANTSHVFHFSNPEALKSVSRHYPEACAAIEHGKRAPIEDLTGRIRVELPAAR